MNSLKEFEPRNGLGSESPPNDDVEEKLAESERWLALTDEEGRGELRFHSQRYRAGTFEYCILTFCIPSHQFDSIRFTEEILKRAAAPVETHFSEIGFNYEENRAETFEDKVGVENRPQDFEDPDEKPYKVPKGLTIPVTVPRVSH